MYNGFLHHLLLQLVKVCVWVKDAKKQTIKQSTKWEEKRLKIEKQNGQMVKIAKSHQQQKDMEEEKIHDCKAATIAHAAPRISQCQTH
jgi:hypothetical protein